MKRHHPALHCNATTDHCTCLLHPLLHCATHYTHSLEYCEFTQWWAGGDLKSKTAPFDKPFELILNLAVGGNLPGAMAVSDIPETAMPMKMEIEYVRVFELTAEELAYVNPFPGPVLPVSAADKVSAAATAAAAA
jgi:hypothetical protein